jgi:hypothetical protein
MPSVSPEGSPFRSHQNSNDELGSTLAILGRKRQAASTAWQKDFMILLPLLLQLKNGDGISDTGKNRSI